MLDEKQTLLGDTQENLTPNPLALLGLNNQLYMEQSMGPERAVATNHGCVGFIERERERERVRVRERENK